jgi:hypothetical protein
MGSLSHYSSSVLGSFGKAVVVALSRSLSVQADLWETFRKPSYFGCELSALGWPPGKSMAFFVPVLSACRLFIKADSGKQVRDLSSCNTGYSEPNENRSHFWCHAQWILLPLAVVTMSWLHSNVNGRPS